MKFKDEMKNNLEMMRTKFNVGAYNKPCFDIETFELVSVPVTKEIKKDCRRYNIELETFLNYMKEVEG